jgi:spore coat polysaccharide biosynthesis protein SpsF
MRVLLRCDASFAIGFGHLFRSLALAREFVDRGCEVGFAVAEGAQAVAIIEREGHPVVPAAAGLQQIDRGEVDALVLDLREAAPRTAIDAFRARGGLVAVIDDPTDGRLSADLAFYPPVPQVETFDWRGFTGVRLVGAEWVVLRRAFSEEPVRVAHDRTGVVITMGGSDPDGMTFTAIESVAAMTGTFDLTVVTGPGFRDRDRLEARLKELERHALVADQPSDMRAIMLRADLAIASFGVTAYELAATATAAVYLCATADHARSASVFDARGAAVSLGVYRGDEAPRLAATASAMLADADRRIAMGRAGRSLVDGRGAARVADRIVAELRRRRPLAHA